MSQQRFSCNLDSDTPTAATSAMAIAQNSATAAIALYDVEVGSGGITPVDESTHFQITQFTNGTPLTLGTGNTATPTPLGPDWTQTAGFLFYNALDGEPTTGLNVVLNLPIHQRATVRWAAAPESELWVPATNDYGLRMYCATISASPYASDHTWLVKE